VDFFVFFFFEEIDSTTLGGLDPTRIDRICHATLMSIAFENKNQMKVKKESQKMKQETKNEKEQGNAYRDWSGFGNCLGSCYLIYACKRQSQIYTRILIHASHACNIQCIHVILHTWIYEWEPAACTP
jgi:hypothetical protein